MDEKAQLVSQLPLHTEHVSTKREGIARKMRWVRYGQVVSSVAFLSLAAWSLFKSPHVLPQPMHAATASQCLQVGPILPEHQTAKLVDMDALLRSDKFEKASIKRLSEAVQIDTQSFDDMGEIGQDKRWDVFYGFADYLKKTFPLVHEKLDLDVVNEHGLLYTWKGSQPALKPTLLMAHQDVVPVPNATVDAWTHPPFSGFYDGQYIWGRGSSDCKNQLIAILESVEELLVADFTPARTVLLSFGFDEEISGGRGAGHLAPFLLDRYGKDSLAVAVDEGAGVASSWGALLATPGVTEKGYTDVIITVRMPGGHSSIPPDHTSIGVISELIQAIEANPYPTHLDPENPYLGKLQCGAAHAPQFPKKLRHLLEADARQCSKHKGDALAIEAAKAGLDIKYLMTTSVAVDTIVGGVKVNALPERVTADVNHRVNIGETPSDVFAKITKLAAKVAKKHNIALNAFNGVDEAPNSISLSSHKFLEVAPVTPTNVDVPTAYSILSGTTRALYGEKVIVSPGIMTGNTDTRYYWDLTGNIFRYAPGWAEGEDGGLGAIHTVDEKIGVRSHIATTQWFSLFIRNMDQAVLA